MSEIFQVTLNQVCTMFVFMIIGYALRKIKLGGDTVGSVLSTLVVNVFMPAMIYRSFSQNFNIETLSASANVLLIAVLIMIPNYFLAWFFARLLTKNSLQRDIYMFGFQFPNVGYMGFPLFGALFGEQVLFYMILFSMPINIGITTYGIYILNPKRELNLKQVLNPTTLSMPIGLLAGILSIKLPSFMNSAIASAQNCVAPCAMLLAGFVLAKAPFREMFSDLRIWAAALVRALLIPGLALVAALLLHADAMLRTIIVGTLALPMGMNMVVYPEAFGGDGLSGAKTAFISHLLSVATLPVVFTLLSLL